METFKPLYLDYLKKSYHTSHTADRRKSLIIILSITLILGGLVITAGRVISIYRQPPPAVLGVQDIAVTVAPSPTEVPVTPRPTAIPQTILYELNLTAKPLISQTKGLFLADVMVDALKLPLLVGKPFPINRILFDVSEVASPAALQASPYNGHYFIILSQAQTLPPIAESAYVTIKSKPATTKLLPYFTDTTYCEESRDCAVRTSNCQENAFNRYETFMDNYACRATIPKVTEAPVYSEVYGCFQNTVYSAPSCVNHHCQLNQGKKCL